MYLLRDREARNRGRLILSLNRSQCFLMSYFAD